MPFYYLQTFGCQMNKSDSERLKAVLEKISYTEILDPKQADIILLNTCSVRQSAEDRIFGLMHNFAKLRKNKPNLLLGITGCMVGHDKNHAFRKTLPMVDLYFPISDIEKLPEMIEFQQMHKEYKDFPVHTKISSPSPLTKKLEETTPISYLNVQPKYETSFEASIPIMSGCNEFCSYCIVPHARGREMSRTLASILEEIKQLKKNGVQFITLLGQNVNSFEPNDQPPSKNNPYKNPFACLLWEINKIKIPWVFFTAPHPSYMTEEVLEALSLPCMINYLHLPLQSGDDGILQKMNRRYTTEDYRRLIAKIRDKNPSITLGTDFIIGFPGETDEMFENTLTFYKEMQFDISYHAVYSKRKNTPASRMKDQVSYETKKERWKKLQHLMKITTEEKNKVYKNTIQEVLIREKSLKCFIGETRHMKKISLPLSEKVGIGKIYSVLIEKTSTWMLYGKVA